MKYKLIMNLDLFLRIKDGAENPNFDPQMFAYRDDLITQGIQPYRDNGYLVADIDTSRVSFNVNDFLLVISKGGEVKFFNPLVKVNELNIDDEIPEGLPNRTYQEQTGISITIDEETGEEIEEPIYEEKIHTWRSWRDKSHPLGNIIDGNYYFMSATFGKTLSSDELMLIHNSNGVELVDKKPEIEIL